MKIANSSRAILEQFFAVTSEIENIDLSGVRVFDGAFARAIVRTLKIHGITVGNFIFIEPDCIYCVDNRKEISKRLLVHELTHVIQYKKHGFFPFLRRYFGDYFRNLQRKGKWNSEARMHAYFEIPFEIEAREKEAIFRAWYVLRKTTIQEY